LFKSSPHYVAPQDFNGRKGSFTILTPENYDERGAQLSLRFPDGDMPLVFAEMIKRGVIGDNATRRSSGSHPSHCIALLRIVGGLRTR